MARTAVQNDAPTNKVAKLIYQVRRPISYCEMYFVTTTIWFERYTT